jgi:hypothetical protein
MAPMVEFLHSQVEDFPLQKRALTLDAFFVLHWWLADDRKKKNPKASKRS